MHGLDIVAGGRLVREEEGLFYQLNRPSSRAKAWLFFWMPKLFFQLCLACLHLYAIDHFWHTCGWSFVVSFIVGWLIAFPFCSVGQVIFTNWWLDRFCDLLHPSARMVYSDKLQAELYGERKSKED